MVRVMVIKTLQCSVHSQLFCFCLLWIITTHAQYIPTKCSSNLSGYPCVNSTSEEELDEYSYNLPGLHGSIKTLLIELSRNLTHSPPLNPMPKTNCDASVLWVRFAGCYLQQVSTNALGRFRREEEDFHPHAEEIALNSWCKNKIFSTCWSIFESGCPHNTGYLEFIPRYLEYTCHVYNTLKPLQFEMCSFTHIHLGYLQTFAKKFTKLHRKEPNTTAERLNTYRHAENANIYKPQTHCPSMNSMGPLLIERAILSTISQSLVETKSAYFGLINPNFAECMREIIQTWKEAEHIFDSYQCGANLNLEIDSFDFRLDQYLRTMMRFLKRNKGRLNDILMPLVKTIRQRGNLDVLYFLNT